MDYGLLDAGGALLGPPYCYRDGRTAGIPEQVRTAVGAAELYGITGLQHLPFNTLTSCSPSRTWPRGHDGAEPGPHRPLVAATQPVRRHEPAGDPADWAALEARLP